MRVKKIPPEYDESKKNERVMRESIMRVKKRALQGITKLRCCTVKRYILQPA